MLDQNENQSVYLDRNQLVHAVFWPNGKKASVALFDTDGVLQSEVFFAYPKQGSELAKMIPNDYVIEPRDCLVVSMAGKPVIGKKMPFDTAVVTERAERTIMDELDMIKKNQKRLARDQRLLEEENARLRAERGDVLEDPVGLPADPQDPPADPQDPPADPQDPPQDPPADPVKGGEE